MSWASLRADADVNGVREDCSPVAAGALAEHAIEDLAEPDLLVLGEICDEHAGDWIAVQHPVPHLLARAERWPLGRLLDADVLSPAFVNRRRRTLGSEAWNSSGGGSSGRPGNSGATADNALMNSCRNSSSAGAP